ncbi:MAG: hypothetical protein B9S29_01125 [Opitutia bacterium Tous-C2FEB]|jgi:hypothetical protein|nr:MAG: hypothetical protein B9S29_01125 [Opitutae bacterium Tous-C2FEB]PAZ01799.1 MAG: hypothetical protein CAK89_08310 [Opitutae bacterium AMD-G3]
MAKPDQFRLRWKGAITGPFSLARISDMLRTGEISLVHNIEINGSWLTVRDYFRTIGLSRGTLLPPIAPLAAREDSDAPPPPPGAPGISPTLNSPAAAPVSAAGEALERNVREGYLWCGSTFLFPPLFAVVVPLWEATVGTLPPYSKYTLFIFATLLGCSLPLWLVQRVGRQISHEGLAEISQSQSRLCLVLAGLGTVFWLFMFWFLAKPGP